jgi:hypothetical protein
VVRLVEERWRRVRVSILLNLSPLETSERGRHPPARSSKRRPSLSTIHSTANMPKDIDPFSQDSPPSSSQHSPLPSSSPLDEADWSGSRPSSPVDAPPPPQVPRPDTTPAQNPASSSSANSPLSPLPRSTSHQQQRLLSPETTRAYNTRQNEDEPLTGIAKALAQEGWSIEVSPLTA